MPRAASTHVCGSLPSPSALITGSARLPARAGCCAAATSTSTRPRFAAGLRGTSAAFVARCSPTPTRWWRWTCTAGAPHAFSMDEDLHEGLALAATWPRLAAALRWRASSFHGRPHGDLPGGRHPDGTVRHRRRLALRGAPARLVPTPIKLHHVAAQLVETRRNPKTLSMAAPPAHGKQPRSLSGQVELLLVTVKSVVRTTTRQPRTA